MCSGQVIPAHPRGARELAFKLLSEGKHVADIRRIGGVGNSFGDEIAILQKLCVAANSILRCHVKQSPGGVTAVECGFAQHNSRNSKPTVIARIAVAQPEHKR